MLQQITEAL